MTPCHKAVPSTKAAPIKPAQSLRSSYQLGRCSTSAFSIAIGRLPRPRNSLARPCETCAITGRVHPRHWCGRLAFMMRNFGPEDFARRLLPKPVTAVFAAVTLLLCLANSPPAFAQVDPYRWFEQLFRPEQPSHVAKPRSEFPRSAPREHLSRPRSSYPAAERAARRPT